jgi:multidrug efflux pump subunit AcrB
MVVKYLIHRPVAVFTAFTTIAIIGFLIYFQLPETLLPSIDPPQLVVKVKTSGASPQYVESNILKPLRINLAGIYGLEEVNSIASNEAGQITLGFAYGTDMKLAFIEANEKIDQLLGELPPDLVRPEIFPVNSTDIPIVRIQINSENQTLSSLTFFTQYVLSKRVQAIEGVARVQLGGQLEPVISIIPNKNRLAAQGLNDQDIIKAINAANFQDFQVSVTDGIYAYNITIDNPVKNVASLKLLPIGKMFIPLEQLAEIEVKGDKPLSAHYYNGQRGLVLNVHRTTTSNLNDLNERITQNMATIEQEYPSINFELSQSQQTYLSKSLGQLYTALILGLFFSVVVIYIFTRNIKMSLVMLLVIPLSMAITSIIFYMLGLTINIITLSGVILGLGLLIDNSIILIDTIADEARSKSIDEACISGTSIVFTPLLSSAFTTIAVFIPLLAVGGLAAVFFTKQALSLTAILISSLAVTYTFTPLAFRYIVNATSGVTRLQKTLTGFYKKSQKALSSKKLSIAAALLILVGVLCATQIDSHQLPEIATSEAEITVIWREALTLEANTARVHEIISFIAPKPIESELDLGLHDLNPSDLSLLNKAIIYLKFHSADERITAEQSIKQILAHYPGVKYHIQRAKNPFDQLVSATQLPLSIRIRTERDKAKNLAGLPPGFTEGLGYIEQQEIKLTINEYRMAASNLSYEHLIQHLKTSLSRSKIATIKNTSSSISVVLDNSNEHSLSVLLDQPIAFDDSSKNQYYLKDFVSASVISGPQFITADLAGTFQEINYNTPVSSNLIDQIQTWALTDNHIIDMSGAYFNNEEELFSLLLAIIGAIVLLYVILAAQFESLKQPFIIILTVPLTIFGAIVGLYITDHTFNISSLIGIIIMLGIMVNDSILKIDAINSNLKKGFVLAEAISTAGLLRLKPILMTSLTTILALSPTLWSSGLGAEIQKPLAVVVISGLIFGTLISIYLVPALYRGFHNNT